MQNNKRQREHHTRFAKRLRRLGLSLIDAQAWTQIPYGSLKNYKQGRVTAPRSALRMLALYRLIHWGKF